MRFSFLHAADIHLDSPLRGLVSRGDVANQFLEASRQAFDNMISMAIERDVKFVLIAGDLYDGDWRDWASGHFVVRQLSRLQRATIPVFMIKGNHDADSVLSRGLPYPPNVVELSVQSVQSVPVEGCDVVIHGRGFATRHVAENIALTYPQAVPGRFNIGMLHSSLTGRDGHGEYAPCSVEDLRSKGYDYWALGHIHQREVVSVDPYVVFPGNLQGRHSDEVGAKGATIVTVEDGRIVEVEAVVCDVARFDEKEVDLDGATDKGDLAERFMAIARAAKADADGRPVALRLRLVGKTSLGRLVASDPDALREELQALASSVSSDLLIHKVEDATSDTENSRPLSIPHFDELLAECASDPDFHAGLAATLSELRAKLPPEALALMEQGGGSLQDHVSDAISSASRSLVSRLGMEGS